MTQDIAPIIKKYDGMAVVDIASSPDIGRDIAILGQTIEDKNSSSDEAKQFLKDLMQKVESTIQDTKATMANEKGAMDRVQKMANACAAYLKT